MSAEAWEYMGVVLRSGESASDVLDPLGAVGWEAVTAAHDRSQTWVLLKRRTPPPQEGD